MSLSFSRSFVLAVKQVIRLNQWQEDRFAERLIVLRLTTSAGDVQAAR